MKQEADERGPISWLPLTNVVESKRVGTPLSLVLPSSLLLPLAASLPFFLGAVCSHSAGVSATC